MMNTSAKLRSGDEDFGAVQLPVVALVNGEGLLALSVGTGTGLGQAERADPLAGAQLGR